MGKLPTGLTGTDLIRAHRGMASELAAHLGISKAAVSRWGMIPAEKVRAVSDYTGWPCSRLRPDLWPPAKPAMPASGPVAKAKAKAKRGRTNGHAT